MAQRRAIALLQEGRDLFICTFETSEGIHSNDLDFMDTARFHFEERIGEPANHAFNHQVDYFEESKEYTVLDITQVQ